MNHRANFEQSGLLFVSGQISWLSIFAAFFAISGLHAFGYVISFNRSFWPLIDVRLISNLTFVFASYVVLAIAMTRLFIIIVRTIRFSLIIGRLSEERTLHESYVIGSRALSRLGLRHPITIVKPSKIYAWYILVYSLPFAVFTFIIGQYAGLQSIFAFVLFFVILLLEFAVGATAEIKKAQRQAPEKFRNLIEVLVGLAAYRQSYFRSLVARIILLLSVFAFVIGSSRYDLVSSQFQAVQTTYIEDDRCFSVVGNVSAGVIATDKERKFYFFPISTIHRTFVDTNVEGFCK